MNLSLTKEQRDALDINEVCEQCGYLDLSSFIRLFKSETGVSPGKYRETYRQGNPSGT